MTLLGRLISIYKPENMELELQWSYHGEENPKLVQFCDRKP